MAVYPGAHYRPLNNFSDRGTKPRLGVVLHVNDADGPSLYGWIAGNNGMSCHWQVAKDGTVEQYIDTDNASWCQKDGNSTYLSIETQGFVSQPLTDAQLRACAGIMSWVHKTYGIPLKLAEIPGQRGLGWHGMGAAHGVDWGHSACPGAIRRAQRSQILSLAAGKAPAHATSVPSQPPGEIVTPADIAHIANAVYAKLLNTDNVLSAPADTMDHKTNPFWTWGTHIVNTTSYSRGTLTRVAQILALVTAQDKAVVAQGKEVAALAEAVQSLAGELKAHTATVQITPTDLPVTGSVHVGGTA